VFLEATLRNENRVLYTAKIQIAPGMKAEEINLEARYFGSSTAERGMISSVKINY
jgi:hypothetical protein